MSGLKSGVATTLQSGVYSLLLYDYYCIHEQSDWSVSMHIISHIAQHRALWIQVPVYVRD